MHYLPSIGEAMLTAALLLCSSSGSDHIITSRLVRVICRRCEERPEERQIIFQWLTSLLSQPTVGFQTAADAEWVGTAAVGLVRVAGKYASGPYTPTFTILWCPHKSRQLQEIQRSNTYLAAALMMDNRYWFTIVYLACLCPTRLSAAESVPIQYERHIP